VIEASFRSAITVTDTLIYELIGAPQPDGVTQKSLQIQLPRNAVVNKYEVVITAAQAKSVVAGAAGQVRSSAGAVVLDFGTPRTVAAIQAPENVQITSVKAWTGTQFGDEKLPTGTSRNFVILPSELRTEKLQLGLSGNPSTQSLASDTLLEMPDSPAGLELRIDSGAPVFSQAAAVAPGAGEWDSNSQQVVDLGPALSALTGNPLDSSSATFTATLTSRVPGHLDLQPNAGGQDVLYVRRALFNGQSTRDLAFDAEGRQSLTLDNLPDDLTVRSVRFTTTGAPPPVRVVPPVGPDVPDPPFATFLLSAERAACIAFELDSRLADLTALRVPLAGDEVGGDAVIQLWRSKDLTDVSPTQEIDNTASDPITVDPGDDAWRTFTWKKPPTLPKDCALWAVVTVSRGQLSMQLADAASGDGAKRLLWGSPSGPFHDLPDYLASARGRIRVTGKPRPDAAFAPLQVQIAHGATLSDVTPNPRGTPTQITEAGIQQTGKTALVLTSYAQSTVSLRDIDVVSTT
jgi:hypothetical protein